MDRNLRLSKRIVKSGKHVFPSQKELEVQSGQNSQGQSFKVVPLKDDTSKKQTNPNTNLFRRESTKRKSTFKEMDPIAEDDEAAMNNLD